MLHQLHGIPLRGPSSASVLKCVLEHHDHVFDVVTWPLLANAKRIGLSWGRSKWIAASRYIDDLLLISSWFCVSCLGDITNIVYRSVITFDIEQGNSSILEQFAVDKFLEY